MSRRERAALAALTVGFFALYAALGLRRLQGFAPRSIDLGFYTQMLWSLGHGFAPVTLAGGAHPLTLHVMPVLWPLAALARFAPPGEVLVLAHAAALSLALPAAHRLGGRLAVALALLCPALTAQANFDVHPDVWSTAPLLLALAFERERAHRAALIAWAAAFTCRESLPLLGLVAAVIHFRAERAYALRLGALSLAWGLVALAVLLATGGGPAASVAAHAGAGPLIPRLLSSRVPLALVAWIAAAGLLAPLAPRVAWPALAVFAMNAVSAVPSTLLVVSHYATPAFPFLIAATLAAVNAGATARARRVRAGIALASVAAAYWYAGDGPLARAFVRDERPPAPLRATLSRLARSQAGDAIAASLPLQPGLAARARVYDDGAYRAGLDAVALVPRGAGDPLVRQRERLAAWLAVDPALGIDAALGAGVRLARGRDRRTVPLEAGWLVAAPAGPRRSRAGGLACVEFSVPVEGAPAGVAAVALRGPGGVVLAFAGAGLWVPAMGTPGQDHAPVRVCGPPERLGEGRYAWRWAAVSPGRAPRGHGGWIPLTVP